MSAVLVDASRVHAVPGPWGLAVLPPPGAPLGAVARTRMFDDDVWAFLAANPTGTVVELSCGLSARRERLDDGRARWFVLDSPENLELRRLLFEDEPQLPRHQTIAAGLLEAGWHEQVASTGGPWCFVAEGVLTRLDAADVECMVRRLGERFPGALLLTDTTAAPEPGSLAAPGVQTRWVCDDPASLSAWGLQLLRSRSFLDVPPTLRARMPWAVRMILRFAPWLLRRRVGGYRINRFLLGGA